MKLLKLTLAVFTAMAVFSGVSFGEETEEQILERNAKSYVAVPFAQGAIDSISKSIITRPKEVYQKNTMLEPMSAEAKMIFMQSVMASMPFSLRDMINFLVAKKKALPGLTFDEVIESLKSKALDLNMKAVGHNTPYVILRETYDPESPRVEILNFCDLITMRKILDYSLEFSAMVPCRVTVLEDANKDIWITTLDWDVRWMDTNLNPNRISDDLRARAMKVRENIEAIMQAAATGDF